MNLATALVLAAALFIGVAVLFAVRLIRASGRKYRIAVQPPVGPEGSTVLPASGRGGQPDEIPTMTPAAAPDTEGYASDQRITHSTPSDSQLDRRPGAVVHLLSRDEPLPSRQADVRAAALEGRPESRDAVPEVHLSAPVEMWFGVSRVGVRRGSETHQRFIHYANSLLDDLHASRRTSR